MGQDNFQDNFLWLVIQAFCCLFSHLPVHGPQLNDLKNVDPGNEVELIVPAGVPEGDAQLVQLVLGSVAY